MLLAGRERVRFAVSIRAGHYREHYGSRRSGQYVAINRGSSGRSRSLAAAFRFRLGLPICWPWDLPWVAAGVFITGELRSVRDELFLVHPIERFRMLYDQQVRGWGSAIGDAEQPKHELYREVAEKLRELARQSQLPDIHGDLRELAARFERMAVYYDAQRTNATAHANLDKDQQGRTRSDHPARIG